MMDNESRLGCDSSDAAAAVVTIVVVPMTMKGERGHFTEEVRQQIATVRETMQFRSPSYSLLPLIFPSQMQRARNVHLHETHSTIPYRVFQ